MRKKYFFFAAAALLILITHGCSMPSIELKSDKLKISTPLRTGSFNVASLISNAIPDSFPEEFMIYDMINYKNSQAFVAAYRMNLTEEFDFDPNTYLGTIKDQIDDAIGNAGSSIGNIAPVTQSIGEVPIADLSQDISENHTVNLGNTIKKVNQILNNTTLAPTSETVGSDTIPVFIGGWGEEVTMPDAFNELEFDFFDDGGDTPQFKILELASNSKIQLSISISDIERGHPPIDFFPDPPNLSDYVDFSINGIILERELNEGGVEIIGDYSLNPGYSIQLNSVNNHAGIYVIDLAGVEIENGGTYKLIIGGIQDNYTAPSLTDIIPIQFLMTVEPQIDIGIRAIRGLDISETLDDAQDKLDDIFSNIEDKIQIGDDVFPDGFLNAEITGDFSIEMNLSFTAPINYSGLYVEYMIYIKQDEIPISEIADIYGNPFYGISLDKPAWEITGSNGNDFYEDFETEKRCINYNKLEIDSSSEFKIYTEPDGIDIIFGDNYPFSTIVNDDDVVFTVSVHVKMNVEGLGKTRWKLKTQEKDEFGFPVFVDGDPKMVPIIPIPEIPSIDFGDVGGTSGVPGSGKNIASFVKSIKFGEMELDLVLDMPEFLDDIIAVSVDFDGDIQEAILANGNTTLISLTGKKLSLRDEFDAPKVLEPKIDFYPVFNKTTINKSAAYLEFDLKNFSGGNIELVCEVDTSKFFSTDCWEEVTIYLNEDALKEGGVLDENDSLDDYLSGTYPKDTEDGINLYEYMGNYMKGFTLKEDSITAKVYLNGSYAFLNAIDLGDQLNFYFGITGDGEDLYEKTIPITMNTITGNLPVWPLSNEPDIYRGTTLPSTGNEITIGGDFGSIISAMPKDMRLVYKLSGLPETFTVTPDMFEEDENGGLNAIFAMMLPLEFLAEPGAQIMLGDVFNSTDDLFGRKNPGDSLFGDAKINSLNIKIDFQQLFFTGAFLHLDSNPDPTQQVFGENGLRLTSGNSINITLAGKEFDKINATWPIIPDVRIVFPNPDPVKPTIVVPREFLPTRITITAAGSYVINPGN